MSYCLFTCWKQSRFRLLFLLHRFILSLCHSYHEQCLTLTMANAQASVKFPSWMALLYLAHLGYLDWRSKGGGIGSWKNEPYCAPLLSSFSPARFLGFNPFSLFSPHHFSSLVNPLEWRNIFFVEQETISRFKGGQSGKPMGTIVISEKKAEPPVAITTVLCQD